MAPGPSATVLEICQELEVEVEEKTITVEELKKADTAFFCGTAAEVIGWEKLDDTVFPKAWNDSVSKTIQDAYKNKVIGKTLQVEEVVA